jgi:hypothetical protein
MLKSEVMFGEKWFGHQWVEVSTKSLWVTTLLSYVDQHVQQLHNLQITNGVHQKTSTYSW